MTPVEFTSLLATGLSSGVLVLSVMGQEPAPPKPGSVCLVTRSQSAASPLWACGLPASMVEDADAALRGAAVQTTSGDVVGIVSDVGASRDGAIGSVSVERGRSKSGPRQTLLIKAANAVLLDDRRVIVIDEQK